MMKQAILAAYIGLIITFSAAFLGDRLNAADAYADAVPAAPEASAVSVSAVRPEPTQTAYAALSVRQADEPAPERITVLHGGEVYDVAMQDYLVGVVAAEMPADFEAEALKAQAVAARTYALYCADSCRHGDASVCTDYACCQAWKSREDMERGWGERFGEYYEKISSAVAETDGEYLSSGGQAVFAAFHSSSAGATEDCGAIWSALPYLVSVPSPETAEDVPNYVSEVQCSPLSFRDTLLSAHPEADFTGDESEWIGDIVCDASGRVDYAVLGGVRFEGTELRSLFSLRSTAFTLRCDGGDFIFTVTGFGHGVGMSQYGANVMASGGADYSAILAHYYPGAVLVK